MTDSKPEDRGDVGKIKRFVAFLGLFFILLSQLLVFSKPPEDVWVPPYFWLTGLGLLTLGLSQLIKPIPFFVKISQSFIFQDQPFWIITAFLLSFLVTAANAKLLNFARINFIPLVTVWLLSGVVYFYAFFNAPVDLKKLVEWLRENRAELLGILAITVLGIALRFYHLGDSPRVLDGDEGLVGLFAQGSISDSLVNPFALWENFGALYLQLINIGLKIFGSNSAFALRLLPAIGGVLAIPAVYLFTRWLTGKRVAMLAAFLIAVSHSHIHFSRIVSVAYIQGTWLVPLELYFLLSGLRKQQSWRAALGGILLAIHFSVYLTSQVIAGVVLIYFLLAVSFYHKWMRARLVQMFAFLGGFTLMLAPMVYYYVTHPDLAFGRLNQDGTFQSGWLASTMQSTGQSAVEVLFGRFLHAFFSLFYYPAYDFYGSTSPTMSAIPTVFLFIGLIVILLRLKNPDYLLLNGYFWGATVSVGVFALPPSADTYRMLMTLPAAFIIVAIGLDETLKLLGLGIHTSRNAYLFATSALLFSLLLYNVWTYYGDFIGRCQFGGGIGTRFASYLGRYAGAIDNEASVYLLSNEFILYGTHASTDFLSGKRKIINVPEPVDELQAVSGETIIAIPERIDELEAWARLHPGGQLHYNYDCDVPILLAYRVP
ncbi:MAG: glycosyltransferase family 39 protein [Anaerolineales bacterium]|nr:glycosyltransferase family 39 protein [Anaerolineales bacterium]